MTVALLVIDVQMAFAQRDASGADRSCPNAEDNIKRLMSAFRSMSAPVIHIHHHSKEPESAFRAGLPDVDVQPFAKPVAGEAVYVKHVNSAFIGTSLEKDLRDAGISTLVMCGATANHCVETTTRMAGNLGFDVYYAMDAVWAYGAKGPDGTQHSAKQIHSMSLCNISGEFAVVEPTDIILETLNNLVVKQNNL